MYRYDVDTLTPRLPLERQIVGKAQADIGRFSTAKIPQLQYTHFHDCHWREFFLKFGELPIHTSHTKQRESSFNTNISLQFHFFNLSLYRCIKSHHEDWLTINRKQFAEQSSQFMISLNSFAFRYSSTENFGSSCLSHIHLFCLDGTSP